MAMSVDQKRLKETKFPPEFNKKVDTSKVNIDLLKKWIASKITGILGDEDDVVIDTCFNLLEESQFVSAAISPASTWLANNSTAQHQSDPNSAHGFPRQ